MLRIEPDERPLDEIAVGEVAGGVLPGRFVEVLDDDLDAAPPAPAGLVERAVDQQAEEPGIEPVRVTKPGQVSPGTDERVLDRVARELRVPEDEARGSIEAGGRRRGEQGEGVVIAPRCPLDERPSVHCPSPSARHGGRVRRVWRRRCAIRFEFLHASGAGRVTGRPRDRCGGSPRRGRSRDPG